jgi:hypothetical protein
MLASKDHSTSTLVTATLAVAFAASGLLVVTFAPATPALVSGALLLGSLGATGAAFALLASRVRRLELENMGLIEEISQEFDRVKTRLDVALDATIPTDEEEEAIRRVVVK